jgi:hypothetical protein
MSDREDGNLRKQQGEGQRGQATLLGVGGERRLALVRRVAMVVSRSTVVFKETS